LTAEDMDLEDGASVARRSGFAAVVETHWSSVFRLLFCMTGSVHDAEELTQETFLHAWRGLDGFRPGTEIRSWLLRSATNVSLDLRRKQKRRKCVPLEEDVIDSAGLPGYGLETAEQAELVRAAMHELSRTARLVFHLRVQESLSFREIAGLVGTTEQAARWHMHQARAKLLRRMRKQLEATS
jgi:RNA polymerase sigma-70 factor, ECF subfamily